MITTDDILKDLEKDLTGSGMDEVNAKIITERLGMLALSIKAEIIKTATDMFANSMLTLYKGL